MEQLNYPFDNSIFNNTTSVLLDACFLLALISDKDPKHNESIIIAKTLLDNECQLYVTNIVSAEVLNRIVHILFIGDIRSEVDKVTTLNDSEKINNIIATFTKPHRDIVKKSKTAKLRFIPYKKYFNIIYKDQLKRDLLKVYFISALALHEEIEEKLKVRYLSLNKDSLEKAKDHMRTYMLTVNDASHLASTEQKKIDYLLTLDGDFNLVTASTVKLLKV